MEDFGLKNLLYKFSTNTCSKDELIKICDWFSDEKKETSIKEILMENLSNCQVNNSATEEVNFEKIYDSIEQKIFKPKQKKISGKRFSDWKNNNISFFLRIAALFILLFVSGGILSYLIFKPSEKATIITYSEIKAPLGSKSEVVLPDGSKVWLNAGSKIRYQSSFNKKNRNIFLEGEAYFKVNKNKQLPFIVKTGDLNIVAIGTEFNVKAYNEDGIIETTLIEGKVTIRNDRQAKNHYVQQVSLEPKQKAVYLRAKLQLRIEDIKTIRKSNPEVIKPEKGVVYVAEKIDPEPIISWKDDRLIIRGEEMRSLAIKLERKYNISILFESENIKQFRFTGTLEDETLTQVLDVIKLSAPIDYELDGKKVKIFENKKMLQKFHNHLKRK